MSTNDMTHIFTPYWLGQLPTEDRDDVREWLTTAGVNINLCPGFDYDGRLITSRYYQVNELGAPYWNEDGPVYEDQVREFQAPSAPKVVHDLMKAVRGA